MQKIATIAIAGVVGLVLFAAGLGAGQGQASSCEASGSSSQATAGLAEGNASQLEIAKAIYSVGLRLGADERAILAGMETGLAESDLRNIGFGDDAGPDSRGVFQQRSHWGPLADRMNPAKAAYIFYTKNPSGPGAVKLAKQHPSWPAHVIAQAVQRSAFSDGSNYLARRSQALTWITKVKGGGKLGTSDSISTNCTGLNVNASGAAQAILGSKNWTIGGGGQPCEKQDVPKLKPKLAAVFASALKTHKITTTSMQCDHATNTVDGNVSMHSKYQAIDVGAVDGVTCNGSRTGKCAEFGRSLERIRGEYELTELIYCYDLGPSSGSYARSDHCDHIHFGFRP